MNLKQKLYIALLALLFSLPLWSQTDEPIRYVKAVGGAFTNDGRSWERAKSDLQDAINELYEYMQENHLESGRIYVTEGTYVPTESTESTGGGLQFTSFKIYPGIHIYGGFASDATIAADPSILRNSPSDRQLNTLTNLESGQEAKQQPWNFKHKTILSGNHNGAPTFSFDAAKGQWATTFPGNSYHVVWFATSGFIESTERVISERLNRKLLRGETLTDLERDSLASATADAEGHALPLSAPASIDGVTITGGYAGTRTTSPREHSSYGGGAYLVAGATLRNCVVEKCVSSLRGGGVYMDGGGTVDQCYIHTCQSTGIGIMQGYGGGVCIDYDGILTRSYVANCSSRIGAGLAICHVPSEYPWRSLAKAQKGSWADADQISAYSPHATACIVGNNTSTAEGGGVYLDEGGTLNHLTITRNSCIGQDVSYYGRRHGRSGGVYVLKAGMIYNTVVWGNTCASNNDIQYAAYTMYSTEEYTDEQPVYDENGFPTGETTRTLHEALKPQVHYSGFDRHDITDWAGTVKNNIYSLEDTNTNTSATEANYPYFIGGDGRGDVITFVGAGLNPDLPQGTSGATAAATGIPRPIAWKPAAITSLAEKGVQVTDALAEASDWIRHAHTATDMLGDVYEPASSLGALVRRSEQIGPALIENQEYTLYHTYASAIGSGVPAGVLPVGDASAALSSEDASGITDSRPIPTIFVDPTRYAGKQYSGTAIQIGDAGIGSSWDKPVGHMNDAISYFKQRMQKRPDGTIHYVFTSAADGFEGDFAYVQILIKGGPGGTSSVSTTAGVGAYLGNELRTAAVRPASNMRLYGGHDPESTGTNFSKRNQRQHPSRITANVTNGEYKDNSAHVFALVNTKNVILDGFRIYYGNANLGTDVSYAPVDEVTGERKPITFGGGIIVNNSTVEAEDRIDMTGNILRNSVIANCSAPEGAAIYVNGEHPKADATPSSAALTIVNTIIRNNTIGDGRDVTVLANTYEHFGNAGVVVAHGHASINLYHCNVINNCGYALETTKVDDGTMGRIHIDNSIIYANGKTDYTDRDEIKIPLSFRKEVETSDIYIDGANNILDYDAAIPAGFTNANAILNRKMKWDGQTLEKMRWVNGEAVSYETPVFVENTRYPMFVNPSRNVGHSPDGDRAMNGGTVNYMPMNMNPVVNAAPTSSAALWDSDNNPRTYGGAPDLGAIEDTALRNGKTKYVRTDGSDSNDGNSWGTAYKTIRHAIAQCEENDGWEVWVAAGKYQESDATTGDEDVVVLKSGVSLYGGFVRTGNPGKELKSDERSIGNNELYDGSVAETKTKYQTIIDGGGKGRVLSMHDNFPVETVVEGFTIQNGSTPQANVVKEVSMWKAVTTREYSYDPAADGWDKWDGTEEVEVEVTASDDYDRTEVVEEAGPYKNDYDRQGTRQGGSSTTARTTFRNTITSMADRRNANNEANAIYVASTQTYYWGETQTTGSSSNYDWYTGSYSRTYYCWTYWYWRQYFKNITHYYKTRTRYYRNKITYELDTEGYPREAHTIYKADGTTNGTNYNTAGKELCNMGFPQQGNDYRDGVGARIYANGILKSCLIWKNKLSTSGTVSFAAGAAVLKGSRMESCIVRNNVVENTSYSGSTFNGITRGVGVHAANATVVNSLIVENVGINGFAFRGVGLYTSAKSEFYQCTIAYNFGIIGNPSRVSSANQNYMYIAPGISDDSQRFVAAANLSADNASQFYNCIIWGNAAISKNAPSYAPYHMGYGSITGQWNFGTQTTSIGQKGMFHDCYQSAPNATIANATGSDNLYNNESVSGTPASDNEAYKYEAIHKYWVDCQSRNLFYETSKAEDGYAFDPFLSTGDNLTTNTLTGTDANYTPDKIIARASKNPYSINPASDLAQYNINRGDDSRAKYMSTEWGIGIDINGVDRVQDCQVDKGAYEYDGSAEIHPQVKVITEADGTKVKYAFYYVTEGNAGGIATADSPEDAACAMKLQKVLDAAGRYRKDVDAGTKIFSTSAVTVDFDVKHVVVKLGQGTYHPTRSTDNNVQALTGASEDNIQTHALMVPHGVEVWGGYGYETPGSVTNAVYYANLFDDANRNILKYKTTLSGSVTDSHSGSTGRAYHVVAFTNNVYNTHQRICNTDDGDAASGTDQLKALATKKGEDDDPQARRSVLDGLFLEDGYAYGISDEDKTGAAAIVPDYAHVRNCVIQNNAANRNGGGLYLEPGALVSGCVIQNNTAPYGGGLYAVEPEQETLDDAERDALYARIYNTTVVYNTASTRGGGLWYNENVRVKGTLFWRNTSNDMNNVAGVFDSNQEQSEENYPFSYSAIQARRMPGVNNITIDSDPDRGTRWVAAGESDSDVRWQGEEGYYYMQRLSTLVRNGMPENIYQRLRQRFPSLELKDMAGVTRMEYLPEGKTVGDADTEGYVYKNNQFLEIGARALNGHMGLTESAPVLHRLFVMKTEDVDLSMAETMMEYGGDVYSQVGSSFANPFQKLTDAIDYIVTIRNSDNTDDIATDPRTKKEAYPNVRFEIYMAKGTYYPNHNARGEEGHARSSTFVIPEGVTLIGGLDPKLLYSQAGYDYKTEDFPYWKYYSEEVFGGGEVDNDAYLATIQTATGIQLLNKTTDAIRSERERYDLNSNNVYEPWEFLNQTVLSGNTPHGIENEDNVYHVITCLADPLRVGTLPTQYIDTDLTKMMTSPSQTESAASIRKRMVVLDGLTVMHGNARDYEESAIANKKMFYRGGGIMVDGSWTDATQDSGEADPQAKGDRDIPLIIANSQFQDNNAIQGGAVFTNGTLRIYSSSFVQNYSKGFVDNPTQTAAEATVARENIQYTGGGAVATNGNFLAVNTIFANNEASLGAKKYEIPADGSHTSAYGALRGYDVQGFGGVIWGGYHSELRLMNCNLVKNKAVSYPAVYNVRQNRAGNTNEDVRHFGLNTVFWGNEVTGITAENREKGFTFLTDGAEKDDVVNYNTEATDVETLYFCAYEEGQGPAKSSGRNTDGNDPHETPYDGDRWEMYSNLTDANGNFHNNNVIIKAENSDVEGPNFILPSVLAGKDGYNAAANWMPSRVNQLTDNGWSYLALNVNEATDEVTFKTLTAGEKPEAGATEDGISEGPYNYNAWQTRENYHLTLLPLGDQEYMSYKEVGMTDDVAAKRMLRISSDPLARGDAKAYIDIGVYEYQHRTLSFYTGDEIDIIWVTEVENPEKGNDGKTWETATSNLQAAIETLLKSRNDHDKRVNIIAGSYKPLAVLGEGKDLSLSFTIQTRLYNNGAFNPDGSKEYGIRSLTIRGGYSKEIPNEAGYDLANNPVVLYMEDRSSADTETQLNHLFNILDAEQYTTQTDGSGNPTGHTPQGQAIPLAFEGLIFENTLAGSIVHEDEANPSQTYYNDGGAAIFYRAQSKWDTSLDGKGSTILGAPTDGARKLTISHCVFRNNGRAVSDPTSAVRIEGGGGQSLIINTLFHDNAGDPLDAVNTQIVNCTFAQDGGHLTLSEQAELGETYASELHNSVVWRDDQNNGQATQVEGIASGTKMTWNAITGMAAGDANSNVFLADVNENVIDGPNFVDPTAGNFQINPSMRLLNQGDDATYERFGVLADDHDLAYNPRKSGKAIDRGAYETISQGHRVLYVNPNKVTGTESGRSWKEAYNQSHLQRAIDAAAVYSSNNEGQWAYVFVKGQNTDNLTSESVLTFRDGVRVYGSFQTDNDECEGEDYDPATGLYESYTDAQIASFVDLVRTKRRGMAAQNNNGTRARGVTSVSGTYLKGCLLDGFWFANDEATTTPTVTMTQPNFVVRNSIVANSTVTGGQPVVRVEGGLLYNALVYGNTAAGQPMVSVGERGYVLNTTVVADHVGEQAMAFDAGVTAAQHALSNIAVDGGEAGAMFAPYFRPTANTYTYPAYLGDHRPYYYQLHEHSTCIDAATDDGATLHNGGNSIAAAYADYVDFDLDRDLLGNPRRLRGRVDRGCFETWKVDAAADAYATREATYYRGHRYPHAGSVVYLMEGASLCLTTGQFDSENPLRPGYVLLKPGASLYGNGNVVQLDYLAAEKTFAADTEYDLQAFPFRHSFADALTTTYTAATDALTETAYTALSAWRYDGEDRAAWNSTFKDSASDHWKELTGDDRTRTPSEGYLLGFGSAPSAATTLRFTGWGESRSVTDPGTGLTSTLHTYAYEEDGSAKSVRLQQYDLRDSYASPAHFTRPEDMGWNLKGQPYLVGSFATDDSGSGYGMNVPHLFYDMNLDGTYDAVSRAAGQLYTKRSWDAGTTIGMGDAFFMQTAIVPTAANGGEEVLTFRLPVNESTTAPAKSDFLTVDFWSEQAGIDRVQLQGDEAASELTFELGRDGTKWASLTNEAPQLWVENEGGQPFSLAASAPTERLLPLGVRMPSAGRYTFALHEGADDAQEVWLVDAEARQVVNLAAERYAVTASPTHTAGASAAGTTGRFYIQLGGSRPAIHSAPEASGVQVYARGRVLHATGTQVGDRILVYTSAGQLVMTDVADGDHWRAAVPQEGVYVVRVEGVSFKLMVP